MWTLKDYQHIIALYIYVREYVSQTSSYDWCFVDKYPLIYNMNSAKRVGEHARLCPDTNVDTNII